MEVHPLISKQDIDGGIALVPRENIPGLVDEGFFFIIPPKLEIASLFDLLRMLRTVVSLTTLSPTLDPRLGLPDSRATLVWLEGGDLP